MKRLAACLGALGLVAFIAHADEVKSASYHPPRLADTDTRELVGVDDKPLPIKDREETIKAFAQAYEAAGKPRVVIYLNRDLVKTPGDLDEVARTEQSIKTKGDAVPLEGGAQVQIGSNQKMGDEGGKASGKGGERLTSTSEYRLAQKNDMGVTPTTDFDNREIEDVFQRPFFQADVRFVDQGVADVAFKNLSTADLLTPPKKDRQQEQIESLKKATDWVIELLAKRVMVTVPLVSGGEKQEPRIELTATAIQLKDGVKLAEVSTRALFNLDEPKNQSVLHRLTSSDMIDQVALAVMKQIGTRL